MSDSVKGYLDHLRERAVEFGALRKEESSKAIELLVDDPELIEWLRALREMTPEQRSELDRLRDQWKDEGRP